MSVAAPTVTGMTSIETLRAVHHPTRRRMVEYLHLRGPSQVGTLARELDEQVGSISHHLRMLERAGIVAPAPELATDGRASWWRIDQASVSWSVDDFADDPASRHQARAAERLNLEHQLGRLAGWKRESEQADPAWRRAAFSSDFVSLATPAELAALAEALDRTVREWRDGLPDLPDDERSPVFVFAHGFPTRP
jgi:DNA-binding transcriptional ArsR family regulator